MTQKNRYLFRGRISERKFRDLVRLFALDITADRAAALVGVNHKTAASICTLLRLRMAELALADRPFRGQLEIDDTTSVRPASAADPAWAAGGAWPARCLSLAFSNAAGGCIARS